MSYALKRGESAATGAKRIARAQVDRALAQLTGDGLDRREAVHEARKRLKKVRALLRLVRDDLGKQYRQENASYRDAGRHLAGVRDADALLEAIDALVEWADDDAGAESLAPLRDALEARRHEPADGDALAGPAAEVAELLAEARERIGEWSIPSKEFAALGPGLAETYDRCRRALEEALSEPTDENLHEWRKRVKYHWQHVRLLARIWPEEMNARAQSLKQLADLLGRDHDLALLTQLLDDPSESLVADDVAREAARLIERRRAELQNESWPLGRRLFAEGPRALEQRFRRYWRIWRSEKRRGARPLVARS